MFHQFFFFILLFSSQIVWASPYVEDLQTIVRKADHTEYRKEQKRLAKEGLTLANHCIEKLPNEAACYYYRGQARALYHGINPIGYIKRVRTMIRDWEKALQLDPTYDYGGPYRMLAETYTELPKRLGPKDLRRDLKKALQYIDKAIEISDYPGNHLDHAFTLIKAKHKKEASQALATAKSQLPKWAGHRSYPYWVNAIQELEEQLYK